MSLPFEIFDRSGVQNQTLADTCALQPVPLSQPAASHQARPAPSSGRRLVSMAICYRPPACAWSLAHPVAIETATRACVMVRSTGDVPSKQSKPTLLVVLQPAVPAASHVRGTPPTAPPAPQTSSLWTVRASRTASRQPLPTTAPARPVTVTALLVAVRYVPKPFVAHFGFPHD